MAGLTPADVPAAPDLEDAVLGILLTDGGSLLRVSGWLKPTHFFQTVKAFVYSAMLRLDAANQEIEILTVAEDLRRRKPSGLVPGATHQLDEVGGMAELARLVGAYTSSAHLETYALAVFNAAIRRGMITAGGDIAKLGFAEDKAPEDALSQAQLILDRLSEGGKTDDLLTLTEAAHAYFNRRAEAESSGRVNLGTPSGFASIDAILGGFQPSDLIVVGARPAMGKTALFLAIALSAASWYQRQMMDGWVLFDSLEMSADQLIQRLLAMDSQIDQHRIRVGLLRADEDIVLARSLAKMDGVPMYIRDKAGSTVSGLRTAARRLRRRHSGPGLIIVDYLQLMQSDHPTTNRVNEVSAISAGLKRLARDLDVPVIALSQLSRALESRPITERRPVMPDLRESGSQEQDADVVMFIYRDDYYNPGTARPGIAEIIVAKHRNGPLGTAELFFIKELALFTATPPASATTEESYAYPDRYPDLEGDWADARVD